MMRIYLYALLCRAAYDGGRQMFGHAWIVPGSWIHALCKDAMQCPN